MCWLKALCYILSFHLNLKQYINLYFKPDSFPTSTSSNLSQPPPLLLPFFLLATPANTLVSLCLQLMEAKLMAESFILYFIFSLRFLHYSDVYRCESGRCRTLPFLLTFFIVIITNIFPMRAHGPKVAATSDVLLGHTLITWKYE